MELLRLKKISTAQTRSEDHSSLLVELKWSLGVIVVSFYPISLITDREKTTLADAYSCTPRNIAARNTARVAARLERGLDLVSVKEREQRNYEL